MAALVTGIWGEWERKYGTGWTCVSKSRCHFKIRIPGVASDRVFDVGSLNGAWMVPDQGATVSAKWSGALTRGPVALIGLDRTDANNTGGVIVDDALVAAH